MAPSIPITTVVLSWSAAKDDYYMEKWEYGVYYGVTAADMLSGMLLVGQILCLTEDCHLKEIKNLYT